MTTQDTGPLDWRIAIVDKTGRPTPEFQRRWSIQRNNNALIGSITFGSGTPTSAPDDGAEYVDTSATPYTFYVGKGGSWHQVSAKFFKDLADVPNSYSGAGGKLLRINSGATGVEFDTLTSVLDSLGAAQGDVLFRTSTGWTVLSPGTSGDFLQTQGTGNDPVWAAGGGGGGGLPVYWGGASALFSSDPGTSPVQLDSVTVTIPASTSNRTFKLDAAVTWQSGGHGLYTTFYMDGSVVGSVPMGGNSWPVVVPSFSQGWAAFLGPQIVTVPGDNATHVFAVYGEDAGSTGSLTFSERWIVATQVA